LHSQPEVAVEGWAFRHSDQIALCRNIVGVLPADTVLVVKEHPVQAGLRDPAFYGELLSIPGVVLMNDAVSQREVVGRAQMVIVLSGTAVIEAMCLGIPGVVMGDVYYQDMPGIERAHNIDELAEIVARRHAFRTATEEEIVRSFAARYLATHPAGWLSGGRYQADERGCAELLRDTIEQDRC
jgi:lipid A disaccharide synthetase